MTDRKRVEKIRFFLKFNKKTFSEVLGYTTPQSYTSYLNGSNNISMKMLKALIKHDPRISMDWILKGQGQMLLSQQSNSNRIQKVDTNQGIVTQMDGNSNINYGTTDTTKTEELLKIENGHLKIENEHLKKEVKLLEKSLTDKERLISFLEKNQK